MKNQYLIELMERVEARNPNEPEFHQAVREVLESLEPVIDARPELVERGIIDPTKVTRSALQNASSVAGTLLTTESVIADIPEKTAPAPNMDGGMGGMY